MIFKITPNDSINKTLKQCKKNDIILLSNGIYHEKVLINIEGITLKGESKNDVIIKNKDHFYKIMEDFNECNTFRSYTVAVTEKNVKILNLTIENESVPSSKYGQAVALHADGDNFLCEDVILKGAQDTLFTGPLPPDLIIRHQGFLKEDFLHGTQTHQIYNKCDIYGDVDFIFGSATALFNECNIISIPNNSTNVGFVSAPSHSKDTLFGYLFYKCNLINQTGKEGNIYLSRPWRDYGEAAFIKCNIGSHISPKGFSNWNKTERYKTARYYEYSEDIDLSNRIEWAHILNKDEAEKYYNEFMEELKK